MTAYVVSGLAQARDAGYEVDVDGLSRAGDWLQIDASAALQHAARSAAYVCTRWRSTTSPVIATCSRRGFTGRICLLRAWP